MCIVLKIIFKSKSNENKTVYVFLVLKQIIAVINMPTVCMCGFVCAAKRRKCQPDSGYLMMPEGNPGTTTCE